MDEHDLERLQIEHAKLGSRIKRLRCKINVTYWTELPTATFFVFTSNLGLDKPDVNIRDYTQHVLGIGYTNLRTGYRYDLGRSGTEFKPVTVTDIHGVPLSTPTGGEERMKTLED